MRGSYCKSSYFVDLSINTPFCGSGTLTVEIFSSISKDLSVSNQTLLASKFVSGQDERLNNEC